MPAILYGQSAYRRTAGNLPEFKLVNMFVEQTPSAEGGVTLLSRPGLLSTATRGVGPVQGVFTQEGTFGGAVFTVSGDSLYRDGTLLGTIEGSGPVSFAASATELLVTRGLTLYSYNGTNLASAGFEGLFSNNVTAVAFIAGLFVAVEAGSHRFFWSGVLNGRAWDILDFASAENAPDVLLDALTIGDNLFLLGQESIEVWAPTGVLDIPFSRIQQRLYRKGVIATGCAQEQDNSLTFVGNDGIVYRIADVPQRISDHGIEERIENSLSVSTFTFIYEGHNFFCIRLTQGTWAFDVATGQWCEFQTYGRDNFRARCATNDGQTVILGDDEAGTLWGLSGYQDGADTLVRIFTAAFPIKGGTATVDSLDVEANSGWTELLAGQGFDPQLEMRSSRDGTATWGAWRSAALGQQGEYRARTRYRRCGLFDAPGACFEFRLSDPTPLRVSSVNVNEPGGGRSR